MVPTTTRRRRNRGRERPNAHGRGRGRQTYDRGQVEPLAALVAVFALSVGLSTYAAVFGTVSVVDERDLAGPTLERVDDVVTTRSVARPEALGAAERESPADHRLNVTLATETQAWSVGPPAPDWGQQAERGVSVRLAPGRVRPGRLSVVVWR